MLLLSLGLGETLKAVARRGRGRERGSSARESARTIQALVETPSPFEAVSTCVFNVSGSRSVIRALRSSPGAGADDSALPRLV